MIRWQGQLKERDMSNSNQPVQSSVRARDIRKQVRGSETTDGAGVRLRRYIASPELSMLDPFLLLDVFKSDDPDDYIAGFPAHPHRGFETVTYLLNGRVRHRDSAGHEGVIGAGGVQWMTAGSGIEHSEMPEQEQGLLYGFQLWVNLPAAEKMTRPRYQEYEPEQIPLEQRDDGVQVRVIAGTTSEGTRGAVRDIAADATYMDISLPPNSRFMQTIEPGHNAFIYVVNGAVEIVGDESSAQVPAESLAVLSDGDRLVLQADGDSRVLLVAGRPFHEPVARYGPFVMNTQEEIQQAFSDYRSGKFGEITATVVGHDVA